jgi:hypothetical protein
MAGKEPVEMPAVILRAFDAACRIRSRGTPREAFRSDLVTLAIYRIAFSAHRRHRWRIPARNFCLSFCMSRTSA